jgi:hypothetical protein
MASPQTTGTHFVYAALFDIVAIATPGPRAPRRLPESSEPLRHGLSGSSAASLSSLLKPCFDGADR